MEVGRAVSVDRGVGGWVGETIGVTVGEAVGEGSGLSVGVIVGVGLGGTIRFNPPHPMRRKVNADIPARTLLVIVSGGRSWQF